MHILLHNQIDLTLQTVRYCYIRMSGNLPKTCDICSKTMKGDSLKRHHKLKHENGRMEEIKNVEKECLKQGLSDEQKYEMMKKGTYINMENKNTFKMKVNEKYKNIKRGIKEVLHIEIMDNEIEIVIFK